MNSSSVRYRPMPSAPALRQMRQVHLQTGIDVQRNTLAVFGDGGRIAELFILRLTPGAETRLVRISADDFERGAQMQHAGIGVEHGRVTRIDLLQHIARIADGRNAERLGDDSDMA